MTPINGGRSTPDEIDRPTESSTAKTKKLLAPSIVSQTRKTLQASPKPTTVDYADSHPLSGCPMGCGTFHEASCPLGGAAIPDTTTTTPYSAADLGIGCDHQDCAAVQAVGQ